MRASLSVNSRADMAMSSQAYVKQLATTTLPKPIESYPKHSTPSTKELTKAYEEAVRRRDSGVKLDAKFVSQYASKVGKLIFVVPSSRVDCACGL